ncbi:hypothetical protein [Aeromonas salmonicida]|uniref:hypothetical protein n=1 Tax=Aeromonas salmonicida TaxID=645 RepID=UPI003D25BFC4
MNSHFHHIALEIQNDIEKKLHGCGILCRVFGRGKGEDSLNKKLDTLSNDGQSKKYSNSGKKIQDTVGIRVALYFSDDIDIVQDILNNMYTPLPHESTIDKPDTDTFCVTRFNLIYEAPKEQKNNFNRSINGRPIDCTFEVQLRSVLSEGWHEVEHDLRYKQKEHWENQNELSRSLNGILASLESSEWGMRKIFEELAYKHYKQKYWDAMISLKFRLRIQGELNHEIKTIFNQDQRVAKKILKSDRGTFLSMYSKHFYSIPLNMDNLIYITNILSNPVTSITEITPQFIIEQKNKITTPSH